MGPAARADRDGWLVRVMNETVDGEYQKYSVEGGPYIREHFFGKFPELAAMVADVPDAQMPYLRRGGHDLEKVHAAYRLAVETKGQPTVILAKTIKGYGLGEAGEGRNITHQQKKLNEEELRAFRDRFDIPVSDAEIGAAPFYRPADDSPEIRYLLEPRRALGGFVPARRASVGGLATPERDFFAEFQAGSEREVSTTMAFVQMLRQVMRPDLVEEQRATVRLDEPAAAVAIRAA